MWTQKTKDGRVRFFERYPNPGFKPKVVSVTLDRDTPQMRRIAVRLLDEKAGRLARTGDASMEEILAAYYRDQLKTVRKQTAITKHSGLQTLISIIGPKYSGNDLTAGMVRTALLSTDKSAGWMNNKISLFKAMMRWAYRNELIDSLLCVDKLESFPTKKTGKEKLKYLETKELHSVLAAMKLEHWQLLAKFLSLSGLRIGEAAALLPSDFHRDYISVTKSFSDVTNSDGPPKNDNSIRRVHIQPELKAVIKEINQYFRMLKLKRPEVRESPYWFPNPTAKKDGRKHLSPLAFNRYFGRITEEVVGRQLTAHALRHTHASLLYQAGFDYDRVARRLGHGNDSALTREIYVHITKEIEVQDNAALDAVKIFG